MKVRWGLLWGCVGLAAVHPGTPAAAHVSLEKGEARADTSYKAVLRVTHGCEGSPTLTFRVSIPEGVFNVKPMPKPGWTIRLVRGRYATPQVSHGKTYASGVQEIVWSGGRLPDDFYDEFVFRARLAGASRATTLYFPAVQECEKGENRWTEIPAPSQPRPRHPAPGLKVLPSASPHGHH
ncbi:MAG: DUF1775 domain-containing protein [Alphaproteobacteria bacterium]|nr:DUF1775 domain-containing protein [Alphaproteobacteria bacterium]